MPEHCHLPGFETFLSDAMEQQLKQSETGIKCRFPIEKKKSGNQKWVLKLNQY